ncbi:hypothetical protein [Vibrio rarus]|uniref:hypothetical protein n=1 Tax=Vibrio rarus TaxID=413403 RepID=UPI0021C4B477|nr:hypothetical protein [Vibrio rarus]
MNSKNGLNIAILALLISSAASAQNFDRENMGQIGVGLGYSSYSDTTSVNVFFQKNSAGHLGLRGQIGIAGGIEDTKDYSEVMNKPFSWHKRTPEKDVDSAVTFSVAATYTLNTEIPISFWVGPEFAYTRKYKAYHSNYAMGNYFLKGDSGSLWGGAAGLNLTANNGLNMGLAYSSTTEAVLFDIGFTN